MCLPQQFVNADFTLVAKLGTEAVAYGRALATPFLRGEAELRGAGRDGLEPVRRRVNPAAREGAALRVGFAEDD